MAYDAAFYDTYSGDSGRSAAAFAPLVLDEIQPRSVLDVGCGVGTWLRAFLEAGVESVVGVDGPYVDRDQLLIPADRFVAADLTRALEIPRSLPQSFDLAVSMEVGEHLPDAASRTLVRSLTARAPVVLFSAAIPHQGGTDHVNEQWPTYWAQRFTDEGYATVDRLRLVFWNDDRVAYYYAQNALLFVEEGRLEDYPALVPYVTDPGTPGFDRVHPKRWLEAHDPRRQPLRLVLAALPHALRRSLGRRVGMGVS